MPGNMDRLLKVFIRNTAILEEWGYMRRLECRMSMAVYNSFEIPFDYSERDKYIRAVRFNLIRPNGEIKAGAFKSKKGGVSVTRSDDLLLNNVSPLGRNGEMFLLSSQKGKRKFSAAKNNS